MGKKKESVLQIGTSIHEHTTGERKGNITNRAFARATCTITSRIMPEKVQTIWLLNREDYQGYKERRDFTGTGIVIQSGHKTALQNSPGMSIYKNTKMGEILTKFVSGHHSYVAPGGEIKVDIHNRATYQPHGSEPTEVEINLAGEKAVYRYQKLSKLLNAAKEEAERLRKEKEELKRLEEERQRLARELEEKKAREERERLEAEQKAREEEERRTREEIERIEDEIAANLERQNSVRSFMRKNVVLRSQHALDPYQEDAKRSHIYDGTPIVIDGGPGTGKTTTMIQRLMFLLSYQALTEYDSPLTTQQIEILTDPEQLKNHWLFFSPTELLLQYLRDNMREEGLHANDNNTRTIAKFRNKVMKDYKLFNPAKDGPFKDYKIADGEEVLIRDAQKVISAFEQYIMDYCNKILQQRSEMSTADYIWHEDAISIKARCKNSGKVKDIDGLMNLFNALQEHEKSKIKEWSDELNERLKTSAMKLQRLVLKDETAVESLRSIFERWRRERLGVEENEDEEVIVDDDFDEEFSFSREQFEAQLFQVLKNMLKQLGLRMHDSKIKISKRNQEILDIVQSYLDETDLELEYIGSVALFVRNYASLCRGIESNIIGIIHRLYKAFRKEQLAGNLYDAKLLNKIVSKDSNKHLHPDEQNLLLGFINEMLHRIYRKSHVRFGKLKHKYAEAFRESVRNVIGIDEATDYSLMDYYFMVSFRHYEFSSITLCGDLMQGLNSNGITDWNELKKFNLPKLEVKSLDVSYRQLPTLLEVARELYHDELGVYPSYQSRMTKHPSEPKPLMLVSDDEDEKAVWISHRIREILEIYNNELPSIAIFVGDEVNISDFIERITDLDLINGIDVVDCSGNKQLQNKEMVRVFRLSEVKGMEFEAAFFYDIDEAIASSDEQLMRRYLYVGISRATSHLAATMSSWDNESIIKYFDTESEGWEI